MIEDSKQFSSKQVEALLVMAFFCMFPYRNSAGEMPSINFNGLYLAMDRNQGRRPDAAKAKMDCIWQYFASSAYEQRHGGSERTITFTRRTISKKIDWSKEQGPLSEVTFSDLPIEDQAGPILEVLFANKVIGGRILGPGAFQEEIRMAVAPEMIVTRLFTAPLGDQEVLFVAGAKRFYKTSGYSDTLKFDGHYEDMEARREVVAMDATVYSNPNRRYSKQDIEREVNKAFCAFYSTASNPSKIATGHWGCGSSGGDRELKAVIQLIAASKVKQLKMIRDFSMLKNYCFRLRGI